MQQQLRVNTVGVQAMASRWGAAANELGETIAPVGLGLSCQESAAAVNLAHTDVIAFTAALATQVGDRAAAVTAAHTCYAVNEIDSANKLASVARPVTGG